MKKYLIVLMVFFACNIYSDDVRIIWNDNPAGDNVTNYIVYVVDSADSLNMNLIPIATIPDTWNGGECEYVYNFQNEYIRAAVQAENVNGVGEISDTTRAYSRGELFPPSKVSMATIPIIGN